MAKGQKEAVIEQVMLHLPNFVKYQDNAILVLSAAQLENIKGTICFEILNGGIEYGKDLNNMTEVRTYARSMVMNHLKKAKELNGGHVYTTSNNVSVGNTVSSNARSYSVRKKVGPKGVNMEVLSDEMQEFAKTLA